MSNFAPGPTTPPRPKRHVSTHHTRSQSTSHTTVPSQAIPPATPHPHDTALDLHPDPSSPFLNTSFSPSKARQQAQASHLQTQLLTWLSTLIPASTPAHALLTRWQAAQPRLGTTNPELAGEITTWLQAAMYASQAADSQHRRHFEAAGEELARLQQTQTEGQKSVVEGVDRVWASLTDQGRAAAASLATSAVLLGRVPAPVSDESLVAELGAAVVAHTLGVQSTQSTIDELEALLRTLRRQLDQVTLQVSEFQREKVVADADGEVMRSQMAQWNRETKQILVKIKEYKDRVAALEKSRPVNKMHLRPGEQIVMAEDVVHLQERVNEKREIVRELKERVSVLNGLPPDLEASRNEVRRARGELERLKARRGELFEVLAGRK